MFKKIAVLSFILFFTLSMVLPVTVSAQGYCDDGTTTCGVGYTCDCSDYDPDDSTTECTCVSDGSVTDTGYFPSEFNPNYFSETRQEGSLLIIIGGLINVFMGLLGMLAVVLMLYGGFIWMTAQGDPEKVQKAQNIIKTAVVGIIVIFAAWALATFAINYIATRAISG